MSVNRASPNGAQSALELPQGRPSAELIAQWRDEMQKTGEPEKLEGLIWSAPPKGSPFFWLTDEIVVPIHKREDGQLIACPFCSHGKPKFKRGRFCWFPSDGATRFLGNVCAKRHLDEDLLRQADRQWKEDKRKAVRDALLRANCSGVAALLDLANGLRSAASAADRAHGELAREARTILAEIRRYTKGGALMADQTPPAGAEYVHQQSFRITLGLLAGRTALKSKVALVIQLKQAIRQLGDISRDSRRAAEGELTHMSQRRRDQVEILLRAAHATLVDVVSQVADFRDFFSERNIDVLNRWAHHPGSDIAWLKITFARQGLLFVIRRVGVSTKDQPRVTLSSNLFDVMPTVAPLK